MLLNYERLKRFSRHDISIKDSFQKNLSYFYLNIII